MAEISRQWSWSICFWKSARSGMQSRYPAGSSPCQKMPLLSEKKMAAGGNSYREEKEAAREYLTSLAGNHSRIAVVDIGWAGSGALGISHLLREEFGLSCKVYGLLAGTNTCHNPRPDTSESCFFDGMIASLSFSTDKKQRSLEISRPEPEA